MEIAISLRDQLLALAQEVRQQAYAPYTGYKVGAALLATDGTIYTGVNVETAALVACSHAEATALAKGITEGRCKFQAVAVATKNGGTPCGACRQMLLEFSEEMLVFTIDDSGKVKEFTLRSLLPEAWDLSS